jgi:hypothetical protein
MRVEIEAKGVTVNRQRCNHKSSPAQKRMTVVRCGRRSSWQARELVTSGSHGRSEVREKEDGRATREEECPVVESARAALIGFGTGPTLSPPTCRQAF